MTDDPECIGCGHVASDHPRAGRCGASIEDEEGNAACCDCPRFSEKEGEAKG